MMREVLEKKCLKIKESWPNLQLPKSKIKKLVASAAECNQIPSMGQISCFYINIHVLKSKAGDFLILKQG